MKKFILASLLLASGQMALAANWMSTGVSSNGKETHEVDYDSISAYRFDSYDKNSYYVTAWVKTDYPTAQKLNDGKLYRQAKYLLYVDCLGKKTTWGDGVFYDSNGKVVDSGRNYVNTHSSSNWDRVVPDTIGEDVSKFICGVYDAKSKSQTK
ncbi:hypothetical protein D6D94_05850 [Moraxella catarrhalis]|uniref:Surface-adhesin protein E-like domain-containing protein n=1 Tax=Moraxella catarrhalis TaxID=480 RepID=A0A3S9QDL5_MORCA|nr:surface-adhesin E family protein [Moraxella catarrhalis]ARB66872.1 hypothetical protein A6J52_02360 [Moraxella catarrhalis]AZQ92676.1 hypothetical protein EJK53_2123 [Moraxella catarrhalis]AZQ96056.1 hypothetical protein EJK48_1959 [Moraxella catarrhalis]KZR95143.1 hypothetical protein A4U55_01700 [Moraxella catarrhalis]MCG6818581.1 hypothetical protein [Moraxella catarrhalis]